ncbi:MAG: tyrosine recombinase XerC [Oscillospiraceae bacterium]|jgi:site-specific recombinase XerD|nr:tyrosine recombinase XerC [Oscillospiraceae bacterium]
MKNFNSPETPKLLREFLTYHLTIKAHSAKTVDEYFLDLRMFLRYIKMHRGLTDDTPNFDDIQIADADVEFMRKITSSEIYDFLLFLAQDRAGRADAAALGSGISAKSRARKLSAINSFFKYLTVTTKLLDANPAADIDQPKFRKTLPHYLSLEDSVKLLKTVETDGKNRSKTRDFAILTLFLNCGMRISELIGIRLTDITANSIRLRGKGGKERVVFLNDACVSALNAYLVHRKMLMPIERDKNCLFLAGGSGNGEVKRLGRTTVHDMIKKYALRAGLPSSEISAHKLRHTAATLMLGSGVDVRTLQELLGHENLNTTQIYTHIDSERLREAAQLIPLADYGEIKDKTDGAMPTNTD